MIGTCMRRPLKCEFWQIDFSEIPPQWVTELYSNGFIIKSGSHLIERISGADNVLHEGDFLVNSGISSDGRTRVHPIPEDMFHQLYCVESEKLKKHGMHNIYIEDYAPIGVERGDTVGK